VCTASWLRSADGYELFFNRDESVERLPGSAPRPRRSLAGIPFLAPTDGDAGGTWIGVNAFGVALALLNAAWRGPGESAREADDPFRSRGLLVMDLLEADDLGALRAGLATQELERYRGFRLLGFAPDEEPRLFDWDGAELAESAPRMPLASSSRDGGRAQAEREELLARMVAGGGLDARSLATFHASHEPERGPWSPCMHREDARTVSATHVTVGSRRVSMRYTAGPLCEGAWGEPLSLERAPVDGASV